MAFSFIVEGAKAFASKALPELGKKVLTDAAVKAGSAAIGSVKDSFTGKASQGSTAKYNIVQSPTRGGIERSRVTMTTVPKVSESLTRINTKMANIMGKKIGDSSITSKSLTGKP